MSCNDYCSGCDRYEEEGYIGEAEDLYYAKLRRRREEEEEFEEEMRRRIEEEKKYYKQLEEMEEISYGEE